MSKKKIVVVGSLNMDLVAHVLRMPAEGETITGNSFATYPGGKGANQAVAAARLGGDVSMVGRIGHDAFGSELLAALNTSAVHTEHVLEAEGSSGTAVILVTDRGGNAITVIPGANATLTPDELDRHAALFDEAGIVLAQLEVPIETVERAAVLAQERDVPFMLDPAPAVALPAELLQRVTWLTPNETETEILLEQYGTNPAKGTDDVAIAAKHLLAKGVRNVILKLGERGVYLAGKDVDATYVRSITVKAVDSTAAGDTFNGAFAVARMNDMAPAEAARFACAAAAISVTRQGAQPSMPARSEVDALLCR